MMLEDLVTHLKGQLSLKQLVDDRIYVLYRNQGDPLPALLLRRVGGKHEHDLSGGAGFNTAAVEIEALAVSYGAAGDLANTVRECIDTLRRQGDRSIGEGATQIMSILSASGEVDDFLPPTDGSGSNGIYVISQTFTVRHRESVPKQPL